MQMLRSVDHLVIGVEQLARATDTYRRLLGLPPSWQGTHPAMGTANTLFRLDNTYIELLAAEGDGPIGDVLRVRLGERGEGPLAIAFGADDVVAAVRDLRERGVELGDPSEGEGQGADGAMRRWQSAMVAPSSTRGVQMLIIEHRSPPEALPRMQAEGAASGAIAAVDHVVIMTDNPDSAIVLYRDKLGLRLALDKTFEERGMRLLFFRIGGVTVECAAPFAAAGEGEADGFWGISYRVTDVAAARERIAAAGFDVSEVRRGFKPGTSVATVRSETHGVATLLIGPEGAVGAR